jgi:hypothetical protein
MDDLRTLHDDQVFQRREALESGYADKDLYRAIHDGLLVRIRPGAYTFTDTWNAVDDVGKHRLRAHAAQRSHGIRVALSHTTAAAEHGLRLYEPNLSKIHLTCLESPLGRTTKDIVYHQGICTDDDLTLVDGRLVVRPVRAALEAASLTSVASGLVILDSLIDMDKGTLDDLHAGFQSMTGHPNARRLQITVRLTRKGSNSVGETLSRHAMWREHLPEPTLQFEVRDQWGQLIGVTDFAWPDHGVLGEFDGMFKYGRLLRKGETPGEAVEREKKREDRLREETGWLMVRLIWAELFRGGALAARIRRQLERGKTIVFI